MAHCPFSPWIRRGIGLLLVLFTLCYGYSAVSYAQSGGPLPLPRSYQFSQLTTDDGLPNSHIQALLQDCHGFIWIGTQDGLSRYDGYRVQTFRHAANDPTSLSDNNVMALTESTDGTLWVVTRFGSVNRFDPTTASFSTLHFPNVGGPAADELFSAFQDSRGQLWFGGHPRSGLICYDPTTDTHHRFSAEQILTDQALFSSAIWQMAEDADGNLWIAAESVLVRYDAVTESFPTYRPPREDERNIKTLLQAGDQSWWGCQSQH